MITPDPPSVVKPILTIRAKLLLLFLFLSLSFSTLVLFSLHEIQSLGRDNDETLKAAKTHGTAERLKSRIVELSAVTSSYLAGDLGQEAQLNLTLEAVGRLANNFKTTAPHPALQKEAGEFLARLSSFKEQIREWGKTRTTDLRTRITLESFRLSEKVEAFWTQTRTTLDLKISESNRLRERAVITASIPSAILLLVALVATLFLSHEISRPLSLLNQSVQAMREERFDPTSVEFRSTDEIGNLGRSFVQMATEMRRSHDETTATMQQLQESEERAREGEGRERQKVKELEEAYQTLEKTQEASLNIMEDLDRERLIVENRERQLRETQTQLVQAAKMTIVGTLASGVAHEISNPLQAVTGNLETIGLIFKEGEGSQGEIQEILDETKHAAERAKEIVQGLLRFARPGPQTTGEVRPLEVVSEALSLTHTQLNREGIAVELSLPEKAPPIQGNDRELMQLFVNLITNAMRAMDGSDEKRLKISVETKEGQISFSFEDTGHGIPEEILPRIFEPFFTTSYQDAEGRMKGTGLGLSICQRIAEEHKGRIEVQSKPGKGATFTVVLPC